jgi:hypothetical protein
MQRTLLPWLYWFKGYVSLAFPYLRNATLGQQFAEPPGREQLHCLFFAPQLVDPGEVGFSFCQQEQGLLSSQS